MNAAIIACGFVLLYGCNRIHRTNHFLSDVCFGTLITCLLFAVVSSASLRAAEKKSGKNEIGNCEDDSK